MDNFQLEVTAEGPDRLRMVMGILFFDQYKSTRYPKRATHYTIDPKAGLIFYDYQFAIKEPDRARTEIPGNLTKLPFTLDAEGAADFALRWLAETDYPKEPDHDGDNGKGWKVHLGQWGRVTDDWHSFVGVLPEWAMYGK